MCSLFDEIIKRANDPHVSEAGLSRLALVPPSIEWMANTAWPLSAFNKFLSIRSDRTFRAGNYKRKALGDLSDEFLDPTCSSFGTGIEIVEHAEACIDEGALRIFLSRLPRLRTFKLTYSTAVYAKSHSMDADALMRAIEDEVGTKLEILN
ncbi:hypothetical protein OIDMADRAFT_58881 [Oidiodendron maius Zn]|uniref:Uncharacterized protein n=1 Tax=Oidiodendron maius (strain Zn) TaxID=913774 RepID=A0A0C3D3S1_OIDMZ|nr:hypothetical protein OIDMADRAFT_58881 [Oidiodendron maius Zn]